MAFLALLSALLAVALMSTNALPTPIENRSHEDLSKGFVREFPCNGSVGSFPDPSHNCSNIFFACSSDSDNGWLFACPPGLFFDAEKKLCAFFFQVPACTGQTVEEVSSSAVVVSRRRTITCTVLKNMPDPDHSCSNSFFVCGPDLVGREFVCPNDMFFDDEINQCQHQVDVPACTGKPRQPVVVSKPAIMPPVAFDCSNREDGNYVIPGVSCPGMFVACSGGIAYPMLCPANLRYNVAEDKCLNSWEVPGCPNSGKGPNSIIGAIKPVITKTIVTQPEIVNVPSVVGHQVVITRPEVVAVQRPHVVLNPVKVTEVRTRPVFSKEIPGAVSSVEVITFTTLAPTTAANSTANATTVGMQAMSTVASH